MFEKLENEINDLNSSLDSLKNVHTFLVDKYFNVYDTLVE